ncbi:MAG: hypothetical protein JRF52_05040 [Deltaproteobacteria bacterium]|nr:hypothetical protein [Deltaproteobacteria bacterium]MBW2203464.1 hypothetical protein [Deltaproteobacteria bacterium]
MTKKMIVIACMLCLGAFLPLAHAEDFVIKDYIFTWYVVNEGTAKMEIQKSPEGLSVILKTIGPLTTLSIPPSQAKMIGEVLKKTEAYYREQEKSDDLKSSKTIRSGRYKVTFSSKQGSNFVVEIAESKVLGSAVLWSKDTALKLGKYLRKAEAIAAFADKRIRP